MTVYTNHTDHAAYARMARRFRLALAASVGAVVAISLGGCASLPPAQVSVSFETVYQGAEVSGAQCVVSNDVMQQKFTSPATLVLPVRGQLRIVCDKPGYQHSEGLQAASFPNSNTSNGTVSIGLGGGSGHVGLGLGLLLPLGGNAGGSSGITYPARVVVEMRLEQSEPKPNQ